MFNLLISFSSCLAVRVKNKNQMDGLNKEDKAVIRKIIMVLPWSPDDSAHVRYLRAINKFSAMIKKGSTRKKALYRACHAAANGIEEHRILAVNAIKDCWEPKL